MRSIIIMALHFEKIDRSLTKLGGNLWTIEVIEKYVKSEAFDIKRYHSPSLGIWFCFVNSPSNLELGSNFGISPVTYYCDFSSNG